MAAAGGFARGIPLDDGRFLMVMRYRRQQSSVVVSCAGEDYAGRRALPIHAGASWARRLHCAASRFGLGLSLPANLPVVIAGR